ncbi:MAG: hypothetical protein HY851_09260 [candidate division Zixibacteria bacterium]|nr:hypothetical protein [candidate division Zixibacteria bacterium]
MSNRLMKYLFPVMILTLVLGWAGCSESVKTSISSPGGSSSPILEYFPLDPGYTTVYATSVQGMPSQTTFTVGNTRQIGNAQAIRWIVQTQSGTLDTSYFVATDSALFYLESEYANPEKILSLPLTVGNSWPRYYNYDVTGYTNDGIYTNYGYGWSTWTLGDSVLIKDSIANANKDTIFGAFKNYPSEGANTFTINAIEPVSVGGLGSFSGALKISNVGYNGTTNFYWFAPGTGLVKYLIGVNADGTGTPQAEGHLVNRS